MKTDVKQIAEEAKEGKAKTLGKAKIDKK